MQKLNFTVNKEKCIKCGQCIRDCSSCIIKSDNEGYPHSEANDCLKCQHCLAVCPTGAISVFGKNPEDSISAQKSVNDEDMLNLIANRRSCRHFKRKNIKKETLDKLKNMLNWVPTGCNFRGLHFSIIEDITVMDSIRNRILSKLRKILKFVPAKGVIKKYKNSILEGNDLIFQEAPHMIVVSTNKKAPCKDIDPIIALSYFELYAQSLGLGTLWSGFAYATLPLCKDVIKRLEIPNTHKISYVMLFGEPDITFTRSIQPEHYKITTVK